jgi:hypothetical protein
VAGGEERRSKQFTPLPRHLLLSALFPALLSEHENDDNTAIARLKGLGQLKSSMTSWGIEPATFQLVA